MSKASNVDALHLKTAWMWSGFGTCSRLQVGAVLARDGRSLVSGYNGAPAGLPHCTHDPESPVQCTEATHAEANVIGYAARHGLSTLGTTLYITHTPCYACAGLILAAGITRVVFGERYGAPEGMFKLSLAGIKREQL